MSWRTGAQSGPAQKTGRMFTLSFFQAPVLNKLVQRNHNTHIYETGLSPQTGQ